MDDDLCNIGMKSYYDCSDLSEIHLYSGMINMFKEDGLSIDVNVSIKYRVDIHKGPIMTSEDETFFNHIMNNDGWNVSFKGFTYECLLLKSSLSLGSSESGVSVKFLLQNCKFSKKPDGEPFDYRVGRIRCLLMNFKDYTGDSIFRKTEHGLKNESGRLKFEYKKWIVTIDKIDNHKEAIDHIRENNVYGITNVCDIRRIDNKLFSYEDIEDDINGVYYLLSLINGTKCPIGQFVGLRTLGQSVFANWTFYRGDSPRMGRSWFFADKPHEALCIVKKFSELYSEGSQDWIKSLVSLYSEVNTVGVLEIKLVNAQIALEMLSWIILHEEKNLISKIDMDKMTASGKIRLLLSTLQIPKNIPASLSNLTIANFDKDDEFFDGPYVITEIRNSIVHPSKNNRGKNIKFNSSVKFDVLMLSIWYIELCIMKILDYNSWYDNCLEVGKYSGKFDMVPWMPKTQENYIVFNPPAESNAGAIE